ncbi:MAG: hypothetical protein CMF52_09010 [Legionellales bacterium]|nr:hypothetical protein [Legionellales bacterium]
MLEPTQSPDIGGPCIIVENRRVHLNRSNEHLLIKWGRAPFTECVNSINMQFRTNPFTNLIPRLLAFGPIKLNHALNKLLNSHSFFPNPHLNQQSTSGQEAGETDTTLPLALSVFCTHELSSIADDIRRCIDELELSDTPIGTTAEPDPMKDTRSLIIFLIYYMQLFYHYHYDRRDLQYIRTAVRSMLEKLDGVLKTHLATETDDHSRNRHLRELLNLYIPKLDTEPDPSPYKLLPWEDLCKGIIGSPDLDYGLLRYALALGLKSYQSIYTRKGTHNYLLDLGLTNVKVLNDLEGLSKLKNALAPLVRMAADSTNEEERNTFFRMIEISLLYNRIDTIPPLLGFGESQHHKRRCQEILDTAIKRNQNPESNLQYPAIELATPAMTP